MGEACIWHLKWWAGCAQSCRTEILNLGIQMLPPSRYYPSWTGSANCGSWLLQNWLVAGRRSFYTLTSWWLENAGVIDVGCWVRELKNSVSLKLSLYFIITRKVTKTFCWVPDIQRWNQVLSEFTACSFLSLTLTPGKEPSPSTCYQE